MITVIENTGADRVIPEKQNVHCLLRLFYTSGPLGRTTNARAEESKSTWSISAID